MSSFISLLCFNVSHEISKPDNYTIENCFFSVHSDSISLIQIIVPRVALYLANCNFYKCDIEQTDGCCFFIASSCSVFQLSKVCASYCYTGYLKFGQFGLHYGDKNSNSTLLLSSISHCYNESNVGIDTISFHKSNAFFVESNISDNVENCYCGLRVSDVEKCAISFITLAKNSVLESELFYLFSNYELNIRMVNCISNDGNKEMVFHIGGTVEIKESVFFNNTGTLFHFGEEGKMLIYDCVLAHHGIKFNTNKYETIMIQYSFMNSLNINYNISCYEQNKCSDPRNYTMIIVISLFIIISFSVMVLTKQMKPRNENEIVFGEIVNNNNVYSEFG